MLLVPLLLPALFWWHLSVGKESFHWAWRKHSNRRGEHHPAASSHGDLPCRHDPTQVTVTALTSSQPVPTNISRPSVVKTCLTYSVFSPVQAVQDLSRTLNPQLQHSIVRNIFLLSCTNIVCGSSIKYVLPSATSQTEKVACCLPCHIQRLLHTPLPSPLSFPEELVCQSSWLTFLKPLS